ncbi:MAG: hypothetical protein ABIQ39_12560 [Ilumatobacteraceae bacterium]
MTPAANSQDTGADGSAGVFGFARASQRPTAQMLLAVHVATDEIMSAIRCACDASGAGSTRPARAGRLWLIDADNAADIARCLVVYGRPQWDDPAAPNVSWRVLIEVIYDAVESLVVVTPISWRNRGAFIRNGRKLEAFRNDLVRRVGALDPSVAELSTAEALARPRRDHRRHVLNAVIAPAVAVAVAGASDNCRGHVAPYAGGHDLSQDLGPIISPVPFGVRRHPNLDPSAID